MEHKEIQALIQTYFDANFEADARKIASVFHEEAHIFGHNEDGSLVDMNKKAFVALIDSLTDETNIHREDYILSLDFLGTKAAVAKVSIRVGDIIYTDSLNFVKLDNKWGIIAKVYEGAAL